MCSTQTRSVKHDRIRRTRSHSPKSMTGITLQWQRLAYYCHCHRPSVDLPHDPPPVPAPGDGQSAGVSCLLPVDFSILLAHTNFAFICIPSAGRLARVFVFAICTETSASTNNVLIGQLQDVASALYPLSERCGSEAAISAGPPQCVGMKKESIGGT